MDREELLFNQIQDVETKFDNAVLALAFSALALSIQFSPKMGILLPHLLIATWGVYLASGFIGAYRLLRRPRVLNANMRYISNRRAIDDLRNSPDLHRIEKTETHAEIAAEAMSELTRLNEKTPIFLRVQLGMLVGALSLNVIFASVNYLEDLRTRSTLVPAKCSTDTASRNSELPLDRSVTHPAVPKAQNFSVSSESRPAQPLSIGPSVSQPHHGAFPKQ